MDNKKIAPYLNKFDDSLIIIKITKKERKKEKRR